jgi:hypothetical protein
MDPKLMKGPLPSHAGEAHSLDAGPSAPPSDLMSEEAQALGTADPLDWEWGDDDVHVWKWLWQWLWQGAEHDPIGEDDT